MQELFISTGELLLPVSTVNPATWACVACDQYTSQPEYWKQAEALVHEHPSALRLVLPEVYLPQAAERVPHIQQAMQEYLDNALLHPGVADGFILLERTTESGTRVGLVCLLDLEGYDYAPGSRTLVRATEGTIVERIPPRLAVRRGAALELSHVILLVDDPAKTMLEPLYQKRTDLPKLYDCTLMLGGGHLRGYAVTDAADVQHVLHALRKLKQNLQGDLLLAVGDGNHSLATAKAYWEALKPTLTEAEKADHPARFAMVEIENIHDEALLFEPIHRVIEGVSGETALNALQDYAALHGWVVTCDGQGEQLLTMVCGGKDTALGLSGTAQPLTVGALQAFLDAWLPMRPTATLDYIHGDDTARELAASPDTVAFLLPALPKGDLFPAVEQLGSLPRKTFSMGEAHEKRYYMEARKLS